MVEGAQPERFHGRCSRKEDTLFGKVLPVVPGLGQRESMREYQYHSTSRAGLPLTEADLSCKAAVGL